MKAIVYHKYSSPDVLELKSVDCFNPVHEAQILTYMKFAYKKVGLLINFNVALLKNGIKRYVL